MSLEDSSNWDQLLSVMPNGAEDGDIIDNQPNTNIFAEIVSDLNIEEIQNLKILLIAMTKNKLLELKRRQNSNLIFGKFIYQKH